MLDGIPSCKVANEVRKKITEKDNEVSVVRVKEMKGELCFLRIQLSLRKRKRFSSFLFFHFFFNFKKRIKEKTIIYSV